MCGNPEYMLPSRLPVTPVINTRQIRMCNNRSNTILHYLINTFLVPYIHLGVVFLPLSWLSLMLQGRLCRPKVPWRLHNVLWNMRVYVSAMYKVDKDYSATVAHQFITAVHSSQSAKYHINWKLEMHQIPGSGSSLPDIQPFLLSSTIRFRLDTKKMLSGACILTCCFVIFQTFTVFQIFNTENTVHTQCLSSVSVCVVICHYVHAK